VGVGDTKDENNSARFGSAHVYERSESCWKEVGQIISPTNLPPEAGGEFESSVAMASDVRRIAIGAPSSSLDADNLDAGRVDTFEFDGTDEGWGNGRRGGGGWRTAAVAARAVEGSIVWKILEGKCTTNKFKNVIDHGLRIHREGLIIYYLKI